MKKVLNWFKSLAKHWETRQMRRAEWEVLEYRRRVERQRDGLPW